MWLNTTGPLFLMTIINKWNVKFNDPFSTPIQQLDIFNQTNNSMLCQIINFCTATNFLCILTIFYVGHGANVNKINIPYLILFRFVSFIIFSMTLEISFAHFARPFSFSLSNQESHRLLVQLLVKYFVVQQKT